MEEVLFAIGEYAQPDMAKRPAIMGMKNPRVLEVPGLGLVPFALVWMFGRVENEVYNQPAELRVSGPFQDGWPPDRIELIPWPDERDTGLYNVVANLLLVVQSPGTMEIQLRVAGRSFGREVQIKLLDDGASTEAAATAQ